MNLRERFDYALHNLRYRQLRTWLTVLGIVVGIASIIILVGLAGGLKASVEKRLSQFDASTIIIMPTNLEKSGFTGFSSITPTTGKLYERDYLKVKNVEGVKSITRIINNRAPVAYRGKIISSSIYAVEPEVFKETASFTVGEGRFLTDADRGAAVLGYSVAHDSFDEEINVGSTIEVAGRKYQVVGILEKTGSSFTQFDNAIFIQFDEGRTIFSDLLLPNEISSMRAVVAPGYDVGEVRDRIEQVLLNTHKVHEEDKDFSVIDSTTIGEQVNSIINILTIFLAAVAIISLLVGAIGVSNTMFMAVMERTHEIGVLKAIGATKGDILLTFLIESGMIGFVGGIIGIILGIMFSVVLWIFGVETMITPELVVASSLFAFAVGMAAGLIPAKNASDVPAIEALRYE